MRIGIDMRVTLENSTEGTKNFYFQLILSNRQANFTFSEVLLKKNPEIHE